MKRRDFLKRTLSVAAIAAGASVCSGSKKNSKPVKRMIPMGHRGANKTPFLNDDFDPSVIAREPYLAAQREKNKLYSAIIDNMSIKNA